MNAEQPAPMPVVRISIGRFDPTRTEETIAALRASEPTLRPAISAMPGLLAYYVGIDHNASTITNTSIWQTRENATAMSTLREMTDLRTTFERLGVVFEPVVTCETLWEL